MANEEVKKDKKLDSEEICNVLKVNKNARRFILFKYKESKMTEKEWRSILKKDRLSI